LWTLIPPQEVISDTDSVPVTFDHTGEFRLEALVFRGNDGDVVIWDILVRSVVADYWPDHLALRVPLDTTMTFYVFPFNPESDSLAYLWIFDGDSVGAADTMVVHFPELGIHEVTAFVRDGSEADTLSWTVTVAEPEAANLRLKIEDLRFELLPPHPNPFNSVAIITYTLPRAGDVQLSLYDLRGREIRRMVSGFVDAGIHSVQLQGADLPAGIYLVRCKVEGVSLVRKAVVVK
jgi:hypothetical protein